jgi:hypothetical protein
MRKKIKFCPSRKKIKFCPSRQHFRLKAGRIFLGLDSPTSFGCAFSKFSCSLVERIHRTAIAAVPESDGPETVNAMALPSESRTLLMTNAPVAAV